MNSSSAHASSDDLAAAPGFEAAPDAAAADWLAAAVRDFDHTVGSVVPARFEQYAWVFHPAYARPSNQSADYIEVRWADVAAANNRVLHPAAEWGSITGSWELSSQGGLWDELPSTGSLPIDLARRLAVPLARYSRTACWFGVWVGKGPLARELGMAALFELPRREMWLLHGPVEAAAISPYSTPVFGSVNLWWPEDQAWCVGTDIDLMTTYVGGSGDCIQGLLADQSLEALAVSVDQLVTWDADKINPLPAPPV